AIIPDLRLDLSGCWIIGFSLLDGPRGPGFDGERMDGLSYEMISILGNCVTIVVWDLIFPNCGEAPLVCTLTSSRSGARRAPNYGAFRPTARLPPRIGDGRHAESSGTLDYFFWSYRGRKLGF